MSLKVAFTGTSGAGKTTLVKFVEKEFGLKHISSSASDLFTDQDKENLRYLWGWTGDGHLNVIKTSAIKADAGIGFQRLVQKRRDELIKNNEDFVTDRSPIDNITYLIAQCGFHPEANNNMIREFIDDCFEAYKQLTHIIYIKPVQPNGNVEDNGSRIPNYFWQLGIDAQFNYWFNQFVRMAGMEGPKYLCINFWDLNLRKELVSDFLKGR